MKLKDESRGVLLLCLFNENVYIKLGNILFIFFKDKLKLNNYFDIKLNFNFHIKCSIITIIQNNNNFFGNRFMIIMLCFNTLPTVESIRHIRFSIVVMSNFVLKVVVHHDTTIDIYSQQLKL